MIDDNKAKEIAGDLFKRACKDSEVKIGISYSQKCERGWMFFYNTKEYINNPIPENSLLQSSPVVVDCIDGSVFKLFDPLRRFKNKFDWLDDYLIMKRFSKNEFKEINYSKLKLFELPKSYQLLNEELMTKIANKIIDENCPLEEKTELLEFTNRNLLNESIVANPYFEMVKERMNFKDKIMNILNKKKKASS